ncbi:uncharacterized protein LOC119571144 [Penaeus monodon]|uniref:uncharacterized protein LOC119571144 n=1 Tax=Penaeus monodon TaxID=6687 RepID=UPI0018A77378|nr:uncharacterized protein LOC119571144 [Penaeus monodon]
MQQTARRCVNEQWQQLSASIQSAGLGPTQSKTTTLKTTVGSLASGKAPGTDGTRPDLIKCCTNKGDRSNCNNYRGISLLSIMGKLYTHVVCLQKLAGRVYPELQCGFQAERSTTDMLFSLRQLQEKCRENTSPST